MGDHPNTEATPSEVEAAYQELRHGWDEEGFDWLDATSAALTAAYAIRLPPLLAELERLRDDLKTATWQFNEAVSLLRDARSYVDDNTDLAEEIDGSLPVIQSALEHCALAARQALQEQSGE